jgi:putative nucleotidyltransferase with HDIG domain
LSAERQLFEQIDRSLLQDDRPSRFLESVSEEPVFRKPPFVWLYRMKGTGQSPSHHPEGSVWNHTMLVTDCAAQRKTQSKNPRAFMWAALLHDIGKPLVTKVRRGKITSYDHDKAGAGLAREFLSEFTQDGRFLTEVEALVRWHMQILFVVNRLPFAAIDEMKRQADLREVALLGLCDRLGRTGADVKTEEDHIRIFLERCGAGG